MSACRIRVAAVFALASISLAASAQFQLQCLSTGGPAAEPLGDREGHAVAAGISTCRVVGGPMDGAIATQYALWEHEKTTARMLASYGISRKPGSMLVGVQTKGEMQVQFKDGRFVSWSATGDGYVANATGQAASLSGKKYTWSSRFTGPGAYVIDVSYD